MKKKLLPVALVCFFAISCTTAYKNTQTPDDVYYSPAPAQKVYAQTETQNDYYSDDNYLRMKAQNYNRWASIDDYSYWNDSRYYIQNQYYSAGYNPYTMGSCWACSSYNPFSFYLYSSPWSNWNQPYCTVVYYKNPTVYYGSTSASNLSAYNNNKYNISNLPLQKGIQRNVYNNSNLINTNTNSNTNNTKPVRLFSGSSSSNAGGSSGGFKSTGSGGNSRPPKPPMK